MQCTSVLLCREMIVQESGSLGLCRCAHTSWWHLLGMYIYYTPISSQGPIFWIQFDFFLRLSKMWAEQPFTFNAISPLHSPSVGIPAVIWVGIPASSCLISMYKPFSLFVFFRLIIFLLSWQRQESIQESRSEPNGSIQQEGLEGSCPRSRLPFTTAGCQRI